MEVALIYSFEESSWFSCTIIVRNLVAAYEKTFGKDNITHINYSHRRVVAQDDLKMLASSDIEKVIFIDHKPTPVDFLLKLKHIEGDVLSKNREYILHIFGDFPLYLVEWRTVFELLADRKVKFICASHKQRNFIRKFFEQKNTQYVSPFPVKKESFYFDKKLREQGRAKLGFSDEPVYIYTGRLSYQKRVVELIRSFAQMLKDGQIAKNAKLLVVGKTDELGIPYLKHHLIIGEYFRTIDKELKSLGEYAKNITLTGIVDNSELIEYYNASDMYLSLSTYHDEDYGMSVAEALSCGLPAVLTNWAGYRSFQLDNHEEYCQLVPVTLSEMLPEIDFEHFKKLVKDTDLSLFDRSEIAKVYHDNFSVEAVASNLKAIHDERVELFTATSDIMVSLTNDQFLRGQEIFKVKDSKKYNKKYFEVYDAYVE